MYKCTSTRNNSKLCKLLLCLKFWEEIQSENMYVLITNAANDDIFIFKRFSIIICLKELYFSIYVGFLNHKHFLICMNFSIQNIFARY